MGNVLAMVSKRSGSACNSDSRISHTTQSARTCSLTTSSGVRPRKMTVGAADQVGAV